MEKSWLLKKKQFEEYQNAVNLLIQGLGASIGFSYNELVRIDGFGFLVFFNLTCAETILVICSNYL